MPYIYSTAERESEPHSQPDIWITQLTAAEVAEQDEELCWEYSKRFPLASMNSSERENMIDAIITEHNITGGWCWAYCLPGCMPDSSFSVPFETYEAAVEDAKASAEDY